jgi:hypothetical protein
MRLRRVGLVAVLAPWLATTAVTQVGRGGGGDSGIPARAVTNECAAPHPEWIWCDDFEQDRLKKYFEYENAGGRFVRVAGVGVSGSFGMRARWDSVGQVSAGALHLAMGKTPQAYFKAVDAGTTIYRDVYWRLYLRLQPGWRGAGADKLSRAISFASRTWAEAMIAHVWSGRDRDANYLTLDPASGTDELGLLQATRYNDFDKLRWLGGTRGATPLFADSAVGRWYCVEAHAKLNDPTQSNGAFELWLNGKPEASTTGLNWVGGHTAYGINAVFVENWWNAGAVQPEERYLDNLVVSTQRIGC